MRVRASDYNRARRSGRATAVRVQPTGTAVTDYQVSLGNRHSLKEAGVIGLPSWSEKATQNETWVKVPRLSATCPMRVVTFDGGKGNLDRCMEFGDDFDGTTLDTAKWTATGPPTVSGGSLTLNSSSKIGSLLSFGPAVSLVCRANLVYAYVSGGSMGFTPAADAVNTLIITNGGWSRDARTYLSRTTATELDVFESGHWSEAHRFEIQWVSGALARMYVDQTLKATHTTASGIPDTAEVVCINQFRNNVHAGATVEYILIRKYVANEPLTGTAKPSATNRALSRPLNHAGLIRAVCA